MVGVGGRTVPDFESVPQQLFSGIICVVMPWQGHKAPGGQPELQPLGLSAHFCVVPCLGCGLPPGPRPCAPWAMSTLLPHYCISALDITLHPVTERGFPLRF